MKRRRENGEEKEDPEGKKARHSKFLSFQEKFGLFPPRTAGKSGRTASRTIFRLNTAPEERLNRAPEKERRAESVRQARAKPVRQDDTVGYLVAIPVPLLDVYNRGADRHPFTLIRKYVKAICTLSSAYSHQGWSDEEALAYARTRLRILLCVNRLDDYRQVKQTSDVTAAVSEAVAGFNPELEEAGYPARLIPTLWGFTKPGTDDFFLEPNELKPPSHVDSIREDLKKVSRPPSKLLAPQFPFASFRTFIMSSPEAVLMMKELQRHNGRGVYVLTGDADLVSLHPGGSKKKSIFNAYDRHLSGPGLGHVTKPTQLVVRIGGAYRFDNDEIARHIERRYGSGLTVGSRCNSVLLTQLGKTLDTAIRKIFSRIDGGLSYFAEPNTAISTQIYDHNAFVWNGKEPLTQVLVNSKLSNPDHTQKLTQAIRQDKNWKQKTSPRKQRFLAEPSAQLVTSSRHDLVIMASTPEEHGDASRKKSQEGYAKDILISPKDSALRVIEQLGDAHNTQITKTQQNSRWLESGYGNNAVYELVDRLPPGLVPFVHVLWTRRRQDVDPEARAYLEDTAWDADRELVTADMLLTNIQHVASYPTAENLGRHHYEEEALFLLLAAAMHGETINSKAFQEKRDEFLQAVVLVEYLFAWAARKIEQIRRLDEVDFLDKRRDAKLETVPARYKVPKLFSGTRAKPPRQGGRYAILHPLTAYSSSSIGSIHFRFELLSGAFELTGVERMNYVEISLHDACVREIALGSPTRRYYTSDLKVFVEKSMFSAVSPVVRLFDAAESLRQRLREQGYTIHLTADDGHCLFRAVERGRGGGDKLHCKLRINAVRHMRQNLGRFSAFGVNTAYLRAMGDVNLAMWGGNPEIVAMSRILGRRIVVHSPAYTRVFPDDASYSAPQQDDIHIFYNGYNHYEAMSPPSRPS